MGWGKNIKRFGERSGRDLRNQVLATFIQGCNISIKKCPVGNPDIWQNPNSAPAGYTGGSLRASLKLTINSLNYKLEASTDYSNKSAEILNDAAAFELGDTLYFSTGLPYAMRVEYDAWSKQAPDGFMRPGYNFIKDNL